MINLKISGMACNHCVELVTRALQSIPGVERVTVNLKTGSANIAYKGATPSAESLLNAIQEAGFEAELAEEAV